MSGATKYEVPGLSQSGSASPGCSQKGRLRPGSPEDWVFIPHKAIETRTFHDGGSFLRRKIAMATMPIIRPSAQSVSSQCASIQFIALLPRQAGVTSDGNSRPAERSAYSGN